MTTAAKVEQSLYDGNQRLRAEVVRRWTAPRRDPTYLLFFITSLVFFAGAGFWLELLKLTFGIGETDQSISALRTAIATYFPAVLGAAAMQLAISETLRSLRALGQLLAWVFVCLALVLVFAVNLADAWALFIGLLCSACALAVWWIVNADDKALRDDQPPPEAATGGVDAAAPLLGGTSLVDFER